MPICTDVDFDARFGARERENLTRIKAGAFALASADADGEINSYLAGVYALPLPYVPDTLKAIAADITRYRLYADAASQQVRERYIDVVNWLKDVARGLVLLTDESGTRLPPPTTASQAVVGVAPAAGRRPLIYSDAFASAYEPDTGWSP